VVGLRRIEPEVMPLLPAPRPVPEHVRLQDDGLVRCVAQELEVDLVAIRRLRGELQLETERKKERRKSCVSSKNLESRLS
jgi:hypothetical protein